MWVRYLWCKKILLLLVDLCTCSKRTIRTQTYLYSLELKKLYILLGPNNNVATLQRIGGPESVQHYDIVVSCNDSSEFSYGIQILELVTYLASKVTMLDWRPWRWCCIHTSRRSALATWIEALEICVLPLSFFQFWCSIFIVVISWLGIMDEINWIRFKEF